MLMATIVDTPIFSAAHSRLRFAALISRQSGDRFIASIHRYVILSTSLGRSPSRGRLYELEMPDPTPFKVLEQTPRSHKADDSNNIDSPAHLNHESQC